MTTPARSSSPARIGRTRNMHLLANLAKSGPFAGEANFGSDLAFWGNYAIQGNYAGFQITNISSRTSPLRATRRSCRRSTAQVRRTTCRCGAASSSPPPILHGTPPRARTASSRPRRTPRRGRASHLRLVRPRKPRARHRRRDGLRLPHAHAGAGPDQWPRAAVRVVVRPERHVPRLPAAARQDLDPRGAAGEPIDRVGHCGAGAVSGRRHAERLGPCDGRLSQHHRVPGRSALLRARAPGRARSSTSATRPIPSRSRA